MIERIVTAMAAPADVSEILRMLKRKDGYLESVRERARERDEKVVSRLLSDESGRESKELDA